LLQLRRLLSATSPVIFENKAHSIAFLQHADPSSLKRAHVNENIFATTLIRLDEAEPLRSVEELDGTSWHDPSPIRIVTLTVA